MKMAKLITSWNDEEDFNKQLKELCKMHTVIDVSLSTVMDKDNIAYCAVVSWEQRKTE